jgi:hypothetical protein
VGTFPLTYALILDVPKLLDPWKVLLLDPVFLISFSGISGFLMSAIYGLSREKYLLEKYDRSVLRMIAATFFIMPCILMGLSKAYQLNQMHGMAYLPVYFSYFGIAIALGLLFVRFQTISSKSTRAVLTGALIVFIAFVGGFHSYYNYKVFHFLEDSSAYERDAVFEGIKAGLMEGLDESSVVVSRIKVIYNTENHFRSLAATVLERPPYFLSIDRLDDLPSSLYPGKTIYLLDGQIESRNGGWLALIQLRLKETEKLELKKVDLCNARGSVVRLMNLTSGYQKKDRIFSFDSGGEKIIIDSRQQEKKPIVGNWLRHAYNQPRLIQEYQVWNLNSKPMRACSIQSR